MLQLARTKEFIIKEHWPFFLYVLLSIAALFFHECWREETQALLIAKSPLGFSEFFGTIRAQETQPFLWFFFLKVFSPVGVQVVGLQIANALLMIATVGIFWWKYPLSRNLKTLFVFNYYFLFEFGVVAHAYSLGIFLIFYYVAFSHSPSRLLRELAFVALLLSTQVTSYTLILACALFIPRMLNDTPSPRKIVEVLLVVLSAALSLAQTIPSWGQLAQALASTRLEWNLVVSLLSQAGDAFLYIPPIQFFPRIWPHPFPMLPLLFALRSLFVFSAVFYCLFFLYKKHSVLAYSLAFGTLSILILAYFKQSYGVRHLAHLPLLLVLFYWLLQKQQQETMKIETQNFLFFVGIWSGLGGVLLYTTDVVFPFSDAKNASRVFSASDKLIIGLPSSTTSTLSAYLKGQELYYLNPDRLGTYMDRTQKPPKNHLEFKSEIINTLDKFQSDEALFVTSNLQLAQLIQTVAHKDILYESRYCMVADECFLVAKLRRSFFSLPDKVQSKE